MISVIITSFKEPNTIARAVESFSSQISKSDEIIVIAPDKETLESASKLKKTINLRLIQDSGNGKPSALNLAVSKARGDILVLSDGDVYVDNKAINSLIAPLKDFSIGAVSGRPISSNSKEDKYGFWSHLLTEIAHERRIMAVQIGKRFFCSGYLFAIRKSLFPKLPEELLSEDGFISHSVYQSGSKIAYSEQAKVFVKYPNNFKDWVKQKKRSAGGYSQIKSMLGVEMRSFKSESKGGFGLIKYISTPKEFMWLINLVLARVYLWLAIYVDINIKKRKREELWKPVTSTK
ncbi:MAG: glycosyltransferase [Nanoarchaeota archaeon]